MEGKNQRLKLCDLKQIGKDVSELYGTNGITSMFGEHVLVIDYDDGPPPTVSLSDGRTLKGSSWESVVQVGGIENAP